MTQQIEPKPLDLSETVPEGEAVEVRAPREFSYNPDNIPTITADLMSEIEDRIKALPDIDSEGAYKDLLKMLAEDYGINTSLVQDDALVVKMVSLDRKSDTRAIKVIPTDFGTRVKDAVLNPEQKIDVEEDDLAKEQDETTAELIKSLAENINTVCSNVESTKRTRDEVWDKVNNIESRIREVLSRPRIDIQELQRLRDQVVIRASIDLGESGHQIDIAKGGVNGLEDHIAMVGREGYDQLGADGSGKLKKVLEVVNNKRVELAGTLSHIGNTTETAAQHYIMLSRHINEFLEAKSYDEVRRIIQNIDQDFGQIRSQSDLRDADELKISQLLVALRDLPRA